MTAPSVVLVGGHESAEGEDLKRFAEAVDGAVASPAGRGFHNVVSRALDGGEVVVVVPMTFGRNPTMVSDAAKTLQWLGSKHPGRIALAAPFGQADHLTAWLRTAANRAHAADERTALLVAAPRSNPFDEAELHRLAYLVSAHGAADEVGVAIADDAEGMDAAARRLRLLGADRVVAVPAGFASVLPGTQAESAAPLMSDAAVVRVVRTRVRDALAALAAGHDGIADGLLADHGHGYAHSHAFDLDGGAGGHTHPHGHSHPHTHGHSHPHAPHTHDDAAAAREPVAAHDHHH